MSPHKTGTTSIQDAAGAYSKQLQEDGFDTVCVMDEDENECTRHFSSCFLSSKSGEACSYPCDHNLFLAGSSIAQNKRNLFVSTEDFSGIGLMGSGGVDKFYAYLSQWDTVTIIVYYRHFQI